MAPTKLFLMIASVSSLLSMTYNASAQCTQNFTTANKMVSKLCPSANLDGLSPAWTVIDDYDIKMTINQRGNQPNLHVAVKSPVGLTLTSGDVPVILCKKKKGLVVTLLRTQSSNPKLKREDLALNVHCHGNGLRMVNGNDTYTFQ